MVENGGESREDLMATKAQLEKEVKALQKELVAYSNNDRTELERKKVEVESFKSEADQYTDEIYSMETWFKKMGQDGEGLKMLRMNLYGDEYDEEEGVLRELA